MEQLLKGKQKTYTGRPQIRWKDVVKRDKTMIHQSIQLEDANDRDRWSALMVAAMDVQG